jgi:hypothetical protein
LHQTLVPSTHQQQKGWLHQALLLLLAPLPLLLLLLLLLSGVMQQLECCQYSLHTCLCLLLSVGSGPCGLAAAEAEAVAVAVAVAVAAGRHLSVMQVAAGVQLGVLMLLPYPVAAS